MSKSKCPDCKVSPITPDRGYQRPAMAREPGTWVTHCLNCHITDICEIQSVHGGRVVAEARAAKEARMGR